MRKRLNRTMCRVCDGMTLMYMHGEPVCGNCMEWYTLYRRVINFTRRLQDHVLQSGVC